MSVAKTIVEDYLRTLRSFYPTNKPFYRRRVAPAVGSAAGTRFTTGGAFHLGKPR
jgi:hypothetical protein